MSALPHAVAILRDWLLDQRDADGRPVVVPGQFGIDQPASIVWMGEVLEAPAELVAAASREVAWRWEGVTVYAPSVPEPGQSDRLPGIVRRASRGWMCAPPVGGGEGRHE